MRQLRAVLARIAGFFTGHRADDDLQDELQSHLDMEIAENIRRGMQPDAFTTVVVITLALGIGANTAIFSVVRGVLLKPLPHRDGDRLLYLRHSVDGPGGASIGFSVPEVNDFRNGARSLGGLVGPYTLSRPAVSFSSVRRSHARAPTTSSTSSAPRKRA